MINLTDEQKEKIANRIQTPATNSAIKTSLIISKFQPELPSLSETEVSKVTAATSSSISVGVCSPVLDGDKLITVSWIQNGTVHLATSKNTFIADDFKWTEEDTGIAAESAAICYDGHMRKNRIGEPYLVTDTEPYIATVNGGVLEVHKDGVTTRIDESVDCCDMCRIYGTNYLEYDKGLVIVYIRKSRLRWVYLDGDTWSASKLIGTGPYNYQNGLSCMMGSDGAVCLTTANVMEIGWDMTMIVDSEYYYVGTLSDANIANVFDDGTPGVSPTIPYGTKTYGPVTLLSGKYASDIKELVDSGEDENWKSDNYTEIYKPYRYEVQMYTVGSDLYTWETTNGFPVQIASDCNAVYVRDVGGMILIAVCGSDGIRLYRYIYENDVSRIVRSWDISFKSDNSVVELNLELDNVHYAWFESDHSVFNPGGKIRLYASFGSTESVLLSTTFIDEVKFSESSDTVAISSRDASGYFLKDSKIDYQAYEKSARYGDHLKHIMTAKSVSASGSDGNPPPIPIYAYNPTKKKTFEHSGAASEYELIDKLNALYDDTNNEYGIWSRSDGSILVGLAPMFKRFFPKAYVDIDEREVFEKSCTKNSDSVYRYMNVYGNSSATIKKACASVECYKGWYVSPRKECHITIDEKLDAAKRDYYQGTYVKRLNGMGKGYTYKFSFNPAITPKDVARRVNGNDKVVLGIITEVNHTFSMDEGYKTEIYIDSGGDVTVTTDDSISNFAINTAGVSVTPIDAEINMLDMYGSSRNQSLLDLVQMNIGRAIK